MRIYSVTPISVAPQERARRQARYDRISPPGVQVELHDVGDQAPPSLQTAADMQASEHCVVEALSAAARGGYDALMPDCVLDPGVSRLQGAVHVPVIGMLRLNLCYATAVGAEWGAVVRNEAIAAELGNVIQTYGFGKTLSRVRVLGLDVESIADEQAWQAAVGSAAMELADGGVSSIINGCSAAETGAGESRPRIIDPARQALRLMAAGEGL